MAAAQFVHEEGRVAVAGGFACRDEDGLDKLHVSLQSTSGRKGGKCATNEHE
jgi:hypothetical protein